jgi:hypothetical protein
MKQITFTFLINISTFVFAQTPHNFIYQEMVNDETCKSVATQINLPQSHSDLISNYILYPYIINYENSSSNIPDQNIYLSINHFQNQNFLLHNYSSYNNSKLFSAKDSHFTPGYLQQYSLENINNFVPEISNLNKKHSNTGMYVCAGIGSIIGAVYGVNKDLGGLFTVSSIVVGMFIGAAIGTIFQ